MIITVVYCCPESIKQKIISKGGGAIKSIEIKEPEKPKRAKPEKPKAKLPPDAEGPRPRPPEQAPPPKPVPVPVPVTVLAPPQAPPQPLPSDRPFDLRIVGYGRIWQVSEVPGRPSTPERSTTWIRDPGISLRTFGGGSEGPCYEGYGRPVYDSYGGGYGSGSYVSRGDYYSEENPTGCTVM